MRELSRNAWLEAAESEQFTACYDARLKKAFIALLVYEVRTRAARYTRIALPRAGWEIFRHSDFSMLLNFASWVVGNHRYPRCK